jgi:magnesium transporter
MVPRGSVAKNELRLTIAFMAGTPPLDHPVTEFLSHAEFTLREDLTIDGALALLREGKEVPAGQVIYFYVINADGRLVGILPTRQLILSPGAARVADLMVRDMVTLSAKETLFDALELFAMHRLLAIPVVDKDGKLLGIVELSLYTDEVVDMAQRRQLNEVFQLIGVHLEESKHGSAWAGFRLRMPWLVANIAGGLACAGLGSFFEATMKEVVIVALFIPLILTLAESISVQSMTLAIERAAMRQKGIGPVRREMATALLLGLCSGLLVGAVAMVWRGESVAAAVIAGSVAVTMLVAAVLGQLVPGAIHALKLNPRVASGPVTLAIVDMATITLYLCAATAVLRG